MQPRVREFSFVVLTLLLHAEKGTFLRFGLDRPPVRVTLDDIMWFHFSAHAPREALREIIRRIHPKNIVFVHGDPEAINWMYEAAANGCRDSGASGPRRYSPVMRETLVLET